MSTDRFESPSERVAKLRREVDEVRQQPPVPFGELVRRPCANVPDLSRLPPKIYDEAGRPPLRG